MPGAKAASVFVNQVQPGRTAGELFARGTTMLVHTSGGTRIVNSHDGDGFGVALHVAYADVSNVIVDCGAAPLKTLALGMGRRAAAVKKATRLYQSLTIWNL
jgi:hypothetical protein